MVRSVLSSSDLPAGLSGGTLGSDKCHPDVSSAGAAIIKRHRPGRLSRRNVSFPGSEGCEFEIEVSAGSMSSEASLLGPQKATLLLPLHWLVPPCTCAPHVPFYG